MCSTDPTVYFDDLIKTTDALGKVCLAECGPEAGGGAGPGRAGRGRATELIGIHAHSGGYLFSSEDWTRSVSASALVCLTLTPRTVEVNPLL